MLKRLLTRTALRPVARFVPIFRILAIAKVALLARRHLQRLGPGETRRLIELVRRSRSLSRQEKDELRALTAKLEPRAFAGAAAGQISPVPLPRRLTGAPKKP